MSSQVYSDHQRLDARSLALHCLIARKLLAHPCLIAQARATLTRFRVQVADPIPAAYFLEWGRILEESPQQIAAFLSSTCEDATRLRQSSPFTNFLTPEERAVIYDAFQSQKTGSSASKNYGVVSLFDRTFRPRTSSGRDRLPVGNSGS